MRGEVYEGRGMSSYLRAALSQASGVSTAGKFSVARSTLSRVSLSRSRDSEPKPEPEGCEAEAETVRWRLFFVLLRRTIVRDPCSATHNHHHRHTPSTIDVRHPSHTRQKHQSNLPLLQLCPPPSLPPGSLAHRQSRRTR